MEEMINANEIYFIKWLPSAVSPTVAEEIKHSYGRICSMLIKYKLIPGPLASDTTINQIESAQCQVKKVFGNKKNRYLAQILLSAYASFISTKKEVTPTIKPEPSIEIQDNWIKYVFTNSDSFERTVPAYCSVAGQIISGKSWASILVALVEQEIKKDNPNLKCLYEKPLLVNRTNRAFFMKKKIGGPNCAKLSNNHWINLNYGFPSLMELIQEFCQQCGYSQNQIMIFGAPKGSVFKKSNNPAGLQSGSNSVPIQKAEVYLLSQGLNGATVQEIILAVHPTASVSPTRKALDECHNIIAMPQKKYVHVDAFVDLDEAENSLSTIFKTQFACFGGYTNSALLYGAATQDMSLFLNDNDCDNADSVYAIARHLFEKIEAAGQPYKFAQPHIFESAPDFSPSLRGLMIHFARNNGGILCTADAKSYLQKTMLSYGNIGQLLRVNTFLMYDNSRYLLSEKIGIDKAWVNRMHDKLDNLFRQADVAYVIPRDINSTWFDTLPILPSDIAWTLLLLQDVIQKYPEIGFMAVKSELVQPYNTIAAAIVPRYSPIKTFPDIVTMYMQEKHQLPKRMTCESLRIELRDAGMLEGNELSSSLYKALNDYRFAWSDNNKTVLIRGN